MLALAFAESSRQMAGKDDLEKRLYPGGAFDPLGFSKDNLNVRKVREIKVCAL